LNHLYTQIALAILALSNQQKMRNLLFFIVAFFIGYSAWATHNRAGEITYERDLSNPLLYHITITTYTKTSSAADRDSLTIEWGDNTSSDLPRISKVTVGPDISRNIYKGSHLYPGPSTYILSMTDPNRNGGVVNIPGSVNVPFYIESRLTISPFLGYNNSPVLLYPPIDQGIKDQIFIHNPNAYDPDGDSLSYELIACRREGGLPIPGYSFPSSSNFFTLDAITGTLTWNTPIAIGEYNVAFLVKEWRNGALIGYVERDMQITIYPGNNQPPVIQSLNNICVNAGDVVSFNVTATDAGNELITLSATGAPFLFSPDSAIFPTVTGTGSVTGTFEWQTSCARVRRLPYQVMFAARDNNPQISLTDLRLVNITVVGPAPQNPVAVPLGNSIILTWNQSACPQAIGYHIFRRIGSYGFTPAPCETGVPAYTGYVKIASVSGLTNTSYTDNNQGAGLIHGLQYCYMIVAFYPDGALSYASVEVCASLKKDIPVITNVSVTSTDAANGTMYVAWSKPSELDTINFPGPYEYRIFRSQGSASNNFIQVASFTSLDDTLFNDVGLNTLSQSYTYKVELHNAANGFIGKTQNASSVFLNIIPTDKKLILNWSASVPWINNSYEIFKWNGVNWVSIGLSASNTFEDTGLTNGETYCYYVKSTGDYSSPGIISPILNDSQEACQIPVDNVPPCPVNSLNALHFDCAQGELTLTWEIPGFDCAPDFSHYTIYYAPDENLPYSVIAIIPQISQNTFSVLNPDSIAGCYYVTVSDTIGNESEKGNVNCFENCPFYELPNVFTPDGNGLNDLFQPFPYRNVDRIELTIVNRWGQKVFFTTNPDINWNGKVNNTGQLLPDGVYFYYGKVFERYRSGIRERVLKPGFVQMIHNTGIQKN
jgi:gliding motility-associated-like protein